MSQKLWIHGGHKWCKEHILKEKNCFDKECIEKIFGRYVDEVGLDGSAMRYAVQSQLKRRCFSHLLSFLSQ